MDNWWFYEMHSHTLTHKYKNTAIIYVNKAVSSFDETNLTRYFSPSAASTEHYNRFIFSQIKGLI